MCPRKNLFFFFFCFSSCICTLEIIATCLVGMLWNSEQKGDKSNLDTVKDYESASASNLSLRLEDFFFLFNTHWCHGFLLTLHVVGDHSCWLSRYFMGCWGLNLDWLCVRQMPYQHLYYHTGPKIGGFCFIFAFEDHSWHCLGRTSNSALKGNFWCSLGETMTYCTGNCTQAGCTVGTLAF